MKLSQTPQLIRLRNEWLYAIAIRDAMEGNVDFEVVIDGSAVIFNSGDEGFDTIMQVTRAQLDRRQAVAEADLAKLGIEIDDDTDEADESDDMEDAA